MLFGTRNDAVIASVALRLMLFLNLFVGSQGVEFTPVVETKVCDVTHYGAIGDGKTNSTMAVLRAIEDCTQTKDKDGIDAERKVILFPPTDNTKNESFVIWPIVFQYTSNLTVAIEGNITTTVDIDTWPSNASALIHFEHCEGLVVTGGGGVNGNGMSWWMKRKVDPSHFAPKLMTMHHASNVVVSNLTLQHSPMFHLTFSTVSNLEVKHLQIYAPKLSPNTDGIDLSSTTFAHVHDCHIDNGDDNIAIGSGTSNVLVERLLCIDGHGTSIGSIGEHNSTGYVSNITFRDIHYIRTQNVARVKTWQGGHGAVSNISYINLYVEDVINAIFITQYYCPSSQHPDKCKNYTAAVAISDISFFNISGTHVDEHAGILWCSDSIPCENIILEDVNLVRAYDPSGDSFNCWEAQGLARNVSPPSCLSSGEKTKVPRRKSRKIST
eukprot:m.110390 g.110390  ORF g.110390 m.110390 type:complete len:439 (+) comp12745_c0_seq2:864-2180(+)